MKIGIWELLLILAIIVLLFGGGKVKSLGADIAGAIREFRKGIRET